MKKTWKQWIAIACVLSMIACMLPAMTLAEDGVATPTDLTPVPEEPAGEEQAGEPSKEEPAAEEPGDETGVEGEKVEEEPGEDLPSLYFGNSGIRGILKAGQELSLVLHSEHSQNILVTLTLTSGAGQGTDSSVIRVFFNGEKKELTQVENDDPENTDVVLQFCAYVEKENEYTITVAASADVDFILTAVKRPEPEPEQEESEPKEENEEPGEAEENEEPDEAETIVIEPGETIAIRYWVSGLENGIQPGDTVTLSANADIELEGIPTWQVRNEQVEEGKWKRIGYGDHVTVEAAEGDEYRFVMQDGALSEVLQLHITKDETAEETTEEAEETVENEDTEDTEETEQPGEVNEDGEPEEPETAEEETEANTPVEEPEEEPAEQEPNEETEEQEPAEEPEEELTEEESAEEESAEELEEQEPAEEPEEELTEEEPVEEEQPEAEEKPERHITVDVVWDVPDPVIGDTAHFVAVLEGYEELQYTIQWQYSPDEEIWFDIPNATEPTMDVVVTEENNEVFWRILVFIDDGQEI